MLTFSDLRQHSRSLDVLKLNILLLLLLLDSRYTLLKDLVIFIPIPFPNLNWLFFSSFTGDIFERTWWRVRCCPRLLHCLGRGCADQHQVAQPRLGPGRGLGVHGQPDGRSLQIHAIQPHSKAARNSGPQQAGP